MRRDLSRVILQTVTFKHQTAAVHSSCCRLVPVMYVCVHSALSRRSCGMMRDMEMINAIQSAKGVARAMP